MSKDPVGSVAEEAAKLFAVLQQAAAEARGAHAHGAEGAEAPGPAAAGGAGEDVADPSAGRASRGGAGRGADAYEGDGGGEADAGRGEEHLHGIGRGPECQWCPVCQLINRVRSTSPETIEQLSTAAAGVLGSMRSLLEAAAEAARQARTDAESRTAGQPEADEPVRSRVDRIDVSEDPEPWD
ncbi:hypothetical protein FB561_4578 [Kribbella amoyensis]|uniref:Uncharacterized protein n=1 Tax=Kribbella amoyensis TaxID=996641 RepID=A0A561BX00_9ACTN|nr:hypothetical protein [Kribbella amoyensis]TWD83416.1 hypothetical protein FB561_4578 [Kribbella amoyensis]